VLSKERRHDIVWLFIEQPNLPEEIREATAKFPKLLSLCKKQDDLLNNAERVRLTADLKW
jgi:hypothetical protein